MSKLISTPEECGYKVIVADKHFCNHKHGARYCTWTKDFPYTCPLQDGIAKNDVLGICNSCGKSHKHYYYKNGNRVYPRRNKHQCISFLSGTISTNNCTDERFWKKGSMVYPKCIGVNCGYFKTK